MILRTRTYFKPFITAVHLACLTLRDHVHRVAFLLMQVPCGKNGIRTVSLQKKQTHGPWRRINYTVQVNQPCSLHDHYLGRCRALMYFSGLFGFVFVFVFLLL